MNGNPFAPYAKPFEALRAVVRFGPAIVERPSDVLPLLFVAERTASWQKAADAVSLSQFVWGIRRKDGTAVRSGCGLQPTALKQALTRLEECGLLVRHRRHGKRAAYVATEHRINWQRVAEMIESVAIPLAVKRPTLGREATTPLAVKRPHSKDSYSKDLNSMASAAAAAGNDASAKASEPRHRKEPTAAATNKSQESQEPARDLARSLTAELLKDHPEKGLPDRAPRLLEDILRASAEPSTVAESIRASHVAWRLYWDAKRAYDPRAFIPMLWRWFRDGDYKHPPSAPEMRKEPGRERRKSKIEEVFDAIR